MLPDAEQHDAPSTPIAAGASDEGRSDGTTTPVTVIVTPPAEDEQEAGVVNSPAVSEEEATVHPLSNVAQSIEGLENQAPSPHVAQISSVAPQASAGDVLPLEENSKADHPIIARHFATCADTGSATAHPSTEASHDYPMPKVRPLPGGIAAELFDVYNDVGPEADDELHNPDDCEKSGRVRFGPRCFDGLSIIFLAMAMTMVLCGYPVISWFLYIGQPVALVGFGLGGANGTGQRPVFKDLRSLIDSDTPEEAGSWVHPFTSERHHLVFSDEFNVEGRTFWPGDDPFWTAVDIWYGVTGDKEWYSPENVNTTGGFLQITMEEKINHDLWFRSGMLQSWNKFCFQGGYVEIAAILPGGPFTEGWWPGLWLLGNLGRGGYPGTTDGVWPYSYDRCDTGILPNQTFLNGTGPEAVVGTTKWVSYLPGQRMSACTCPGEDHPGPSYNVGRGAPEIDILEAQTANGMGGASQSLQCAPFDEHWHWDESVATFGDRHKTVFNPYTGGKYQEAVSAITNIPAHGYELADEPRVIKYGLHYEPDWEGTGKGSVTWFIDGKMSWTVPASAFGPRRALDIGQRLIPREPMQIIINLGMSDGFETIRYPTLQFPATLRVDHVRVYQPDSAPMDRISCDPPDHPTAEYIKNHPGMYLNPNVTVWPTDLYGPWPKNRLTGCGGD